MAQEKKEQVIRVKLAGTGIKPRYEGVKKGTDELMTSPSNHRRQSFSRAKSRWTVDKSRLLL